MTGSTTTIVILVSVAMCLAWKSLLALPRFLKHTTLIPAGWWVCAAAGTWSVAWILDSALHSLSAAAADHLWYATAVLTLCPPIAVLGSRRPGTRVWTWFILIPMMLVLGWPVLTLWLQGSDVRGLQLETPQFVGYQLVLVMGAGNYIGTRFTLPALLYFAANLLLVLSSSAICPDWLSDRWWARLWASGVMAVAVIGAGRTAVAAGGRYRFDELWLCFFDQFGVVWGRRIQDRVNYIAAKEGWPVRLELHGFEWTGSPDSATEARMEHTFRWLLRRFVDPPWIDDRLGTANAGQEIAALSADS